MKFIIILKIILHNIIFINNNYKAQKPKLIPKMKYTILLEQLYYILYYITKPNSAQKGVTTMCFHPSTSSCD